jgi:hypothetical protein
MRKKSPDQEDLRDDGKRQVTFLDAYGLDRFILPYGFTIFCEMERFKTNNH